MSFTPQAKYKNIPVELLDVYELGGVQLVSIRAVYGKPFVGGSKVITKTSYSVAKFDDIEECSCSHLDRNLMACPYCLKKSQERYGDNDIPF